MFDSMERLFYWFGSCLLENDAIEHIQIRGAVDEDTLATTSDDLLTAIEILGARKLVGPEEFNRQADAAAAKLASVMKSGNGRQHSFGVSFRSSPDSVTRLLEDLVAPARRTAQRMGVENDAFDYFDDQVKALTKTCAEESVYMVVLTHRAGLSPAEKRRAVEWSQAATAKAAKATAAIGGHRAQQTFSQSTKTPPPALFPRHASMVENLIQDLKADIESKGAGLMVRKLDAREACAMMRRQIDASEFDGRWRPRLIGDPGTCFGVNAPRKGDQSALLPAPIGRQIVVQGYKEIFGDAEMAKSGPVFYGSVVMEIPPESGRGEFDWVARRIGRQIPWSVSFEISPNGSRSRQIDQFYSGMVGGFGDHNKKVRQAWLELKARHNNGDYVVALRAVFTTWGASEPEVVDRLSYLRSTLESWESSVVTNETGTPALAAMASAAGLTKRSPAPYMPGPIMDLARLLPMFRPASVWSSGQLLAHTREGRPYPVAFGSTLQNFWGVLGFAPSGSGKSFTLAQINYGILMSPGINELPPLVTIDVGPGSSYVLKLVKAMLPERLRSQVAWFRVRNDKEHTVNPFDTQLGCDQPTEVDRDFQVAVLTTVCPNLGSEGDKFCSQVIREAYRRFGRNSPTCRAWQSSYDPELDAKLRESGYEFHETTRVWDVVDYLFDKKDYEAANQAHRYAMPRLSDMVQAAQSKIIQDQYGGEAPALTPNGEPMISVFVRNITSAQGEYAVISGFTRFDVGNARAIAIDLEEVVGSQTSEEGKRRSGIMFLFARRLGARNFFMRWDEIQGLVPDRYRAYQEERVTKMSESLKFLEYDEKHYTTGVVSVDKQLSVDLRVGRKYKTVTMMFSQNLEDFDSAAVNNCFTYLVMGKGTREASHRLQQTFGLSSSELNAIESECVKPGRLFGLFKTDLGDTSQILYTTAGPFCQWAFTSSRDDVLLRTELEKRMPYMDALRALTKVFPGGSARKVLELYRLRRSETDSDHRSEAEIFADKVIDALTRPDARFVI